MSLSALWWNVIVKKNPIAYFYIISSRRKLRRTNHCGAKYHESALFGFSYNAQGLNLFFAFCSILAAYCLLTYWCTTQEDKRMEDLLTASVTDWNKKRCSGKNRGTQRLFSVMPCIISVRRSKDYLEFSITWGRLKLSRCAFHSGAIFEAHLNNSLRFSEV